VNLKGVVENDGARPDTIHQFVFGDELARGAHKNLQNLEGAPANRHGNAAQPKLAPIEINLALTRRAYKTTGPSEHSETIPLLRVFQVYSESRHSARNAWLRHCPGNLLDDVKYAAQAPRSRSDIIEKYDLVCDANGAWLIKYNLDEINVTQ
jgi:hypothetical protein